MEEVTSGTPVDHVTQQHCPLTASHKLSTTVLLHQSANGRQVSIGDRQMNELAA